MFTIINVQLWLPLHNTALRSDFNQLKKISNSYHKHMSMMASSLTGYIINQMVDQFFYSAILNQILQQLSVDYWVNVKNTNVRVIFWFCLNLLSFRTMNIVATNQWNFFQKNIHSYPVAVFLCWMVMLSHLTCPGRDIIEEFYFTTQAGVYYDSLTVVTCQLA